MNVSRARRTVLMGIGATLLVLAACSSSPASSPTPLPASDRTGVAPINGLAQSSTGGNVTIDAKWLGTQGSVLSFQVTMDTHSVDLDQYDLGRLTLLRDGTGQEYSPTAWLSAPGGHHRSGTLSFPAPEALAQGKASSIQIVIRDVSGVAERVLQWQLG